MPILALAGTLFPRTNPLAHMCDSGTQHDVIVKTEVDSCLLLVLMTLESVLCTYFEGFRAFRALVPVTVRRRVAAARVGLAVLQETCKNICADKIY